MNISLLLILVLSLVTINLSFATIHDLINSIKTTSNEHTVGVCISTKPPSDTGNYLYILTDPESWHNTGMNIDKLNSDQIRKLLQISSNSLGFINQIEWESDGSLKSQKFFGHNIQVSYENGLGSVIVTRPEEHFEEIPWEGFNCTRSLKTFDENGTVTETTSFGAPRESVEVVDYNNISFDALLEIVSMIDTAFRSGSTKPNTHAFLLEKLHTHTRLPKTIWSVFINSLPVEMVSNLNGTFKFKGNVIRIYGENK